MRGSDTRVALEAERRVASDRVQTLRAEHDGLAGDAGEANGDDEHDPEGATLAYERARVAALLADAESHLSDLDRALAKVATGTYAVCERCSGPIARERLEALPATRTCFGCAAEREPSQLTSTSGRGNPSASHSA
jgi:RNA polymerase-binding transcription factor DksA